MHHERLLMLVGVSAEGTITASWSAICERCAVLDGPAATRVYRGMLELGAQLRECGIGDESTVICHHDGVEVRYSPGVDLKRLAFLPWQVPVDYRPADGRMQRCWH